MVTFVFMVDPAQTGNRTNKISFREKQKKGEKTELLIFRMNGSDYLQQ